VSGNAEIAVTVAVLLELPDAKHTRKGGMPGAECTRMRFAGWTGPASWPPEPLLDPELLLPLLDPELLPLLDPEPEELEPDPPSADCVVLDDVHPELPAPTDPTTTSAAATPNLTIVIFRIAVSFGQSLRTQFPEPSDVRRPPAIHRPTPRTRAARPPSSPGRTALGLACRLPARAHRCADELPPCSRLK
jgi:hypothetical protein